MSLDEIIDRERKRAFGFTDDRRCLLTYGDFRRLLMEIESAAKRKECELLAQIAELRQKIDDGKFFTPKAARDAIAGERPLDEMLKAPLPTGNAAAKHEALKKLDAEMTFCERNVELGIGFALEGLREHCRIVRQIINTARSTPPRNCDILEWREAWDKWRSEKHPQKPTTYKEAYDGTEAFMDWYVGSSKQEGDEG